MYNAMNNLVSKLIIMLTIIKFRKIKEQVIRVSRRVRFRCLIMRMHDFHISTSD